MVYKMPEPLLKAIKGYTKIDKFITIYGKALTKTIIDYSPIAVALTNGHDTRFNLSFILASGLQDKCCFFTRKDFGTDETSISKQIAYDYELSYEILTEDEIKESLKFFVIGGHLISNFLCKYSFRSISRINNYEKKAFYQYIPRYLNGENQHLKIIIMYPEVIKACLDIPFYLKRNYIVQKYTIKKVWSSLLAYPFK